MLDVNDLANCVMPPNLQSNNPGADTVDPNQAMSQPPASGASGQLVRRLPPQHVAKLRLQQGSTTTASAGPSATPQQIAGSRDAARQVDNASQGGKASKASGQGHCDQCGRIRCSQVGRISSVGSSWELHTCLIR